MVRNTLKLTKMLFLHKTNTKCKENKSEMFRTFAGMTSLTLNSKLCDFIILLNLTNTLQNFVQDSFSIKLTKICHKDRCEGPLQTIVQISHHSIFTFKNKFLICFVQN